MVRYVASDGSFSCELPTEWAVTDDGEQVSFSAPGDQCAVTVTVYGREVTRPIAANVHLDQFLRGIQHTDLQVINAEREEAEASYSGEHAELWRVKFIENRFALLLATVNADAHVDPAVIVAGERIFLTVRLDRVQ